MTSRWVVALGLCAALIACDADVPESNAVLRRPVATPTGDEEKRIIGLVGTMSGPDMWRGEDAFEGADLAVHILNRSVDEGRPPFQLVTLDDEGDPERATELVTQLAANEDTVGIVYAGPAQGLPPAERALTLAGIPAILCYGDLYSARLLRPHLFQASPPFLWQARAIARYLVADRGYRRIGLLASKTLEGDTAVASMRSALQQTRPTRLVIGRYEDIDTSAALRDMRRRRLDALVLEGDADVLISARNERPQLIGFAVGMTSAAMPEGTVVSDSYARGAHHLPIPSFERFRAAFVDWWDGDEPLGWELRAFDAASMIGWAAQKARPGADVAAALETLSGARFGGLDVTFGPDDHTAVDQTTIGLWVRPRRAFTDLIPTDDLPWLPLARGFSIDGERTSILSRDWRFLFRNPPPPDGPAPRVGRMRYAVTSPRSDPVH